MENKQEVNVTLLTRDDMILLIGLLVKAGYEDIKIVKEKASKGTKIEKTVYFEK